MRSGLGLLRATHPLPAAAVTTLVTVVAASRDGGGWTLALVFLSTAAGQASVGWSNDYLDRERDRATGRLDKPIVAGEVAPRAVLAAALVAFPLSIGLSVPLGISEAAVMAVAVASAWLYNLGLKSTMASPLPYALSFGLAPVYVWLATSGDLPPGWIPAATALLGFAAHFLNVIPDLETDRATRVRGLPHTLGLKRSLYLACSILLIALAVVAVGTAPVTAAQYVAAGVALALIAAVARSGHLGAGRLAFRLTIATAGAIVAVFLLSPSASRL